MTDVNVTDNSAYGRGAGFYSENGSQVTFALQDNSQVNITGNVILSSTQDGGGFWVGNRAAVDVQTGGSGQTFDFNGNTSTRHGGGVLQQRRQCDCQ